MPFYFFKNKYNLRYFCISVVKHCNLNCRYCDHFSPLAEEKYIDIKSLKKQFTQLKKIIIPQKIGLLGGEPLLHPQISDIINMTKKIFPNSNILIITNGILLADMPDIFWETCHKNKVYLIITKLKINIDRDKINRKIMDFGIIASYDTSRGYKKMYKPALDLTGSQDIEKMHKLCHLNKGICNYFEDGKLYKCSIAGNIGDFNKYFNKNLEVTEKDYIDIFKVKDIKEIEEYFNNSIDFCRYCNISAEKHGLEWEISKREMSDWTM